MQYAAIPTMYGGVQFRSRLEARWAAMFDLMSVRWEYEPIDLAGYIPDFLISDGRLLVEVKPITWEYRAPADDDPLFERWRKREPLEVAWRARMAGWGGCVLVLGANVMDEGDVVPSVGVVVDPGVGATKYRAYCSSLHAGSLLANLIIRHPYRGRFPSTKASLPEKRTLTSLWREAGNMVQWKPPAR